MPNFPRTDLAVEAEAIHRSAAAVHQEVRVRESRAGLQELPGPALRQPDRELRHPRDPQRDIAAQAVADLAENQAEPHGATSSVMRPKPCTGTAWVW